VRKPVVNQRDDENPVAPFWIAEGVALCAISIFAIVGSILMPSLLGWAGAGRGNNQQLSTLLVLSIALIFIAWRRARDLRAAQREQIAAKERENRLAYRDEVSGLFNRRYLREKLFPPGINVPVSLALLDLDGFKKINDLYGHATGDALLTQVANRIVEVCGNDQIAFRLGGDEFAVCLQGADANVENTSRVAASLIEALNRPFSIDTTVARVGVSIGLATTEDNDADITSVLHRSDIAMYEAKRLGRNRYVWFDADMERKLNERNRLESEIRDGISNGEFVPYFQPMLDLATRSVKGFEVLARWEHPTRGILFPDQFIPIAEATGTISDLSFAVMRAALSQATGWPTDLTISVNISPIQFKDPLLAQRIVKMLTEVGFPANRLELEITESAILNDRELALTTVNSLKNYGVRISLDDFGTGYASLSQLRELPFDRIKIDKSFVGTLLEDKQSAAIVQAIATLGKSLAMPITAEGVEEEIVNDRLLALGCSDAQGWLFGKAVSGAEAASRFLGLSEDEPTTVEAEESVRPTADRRDYLRRGGAAG